MKVKINDQHCPKEYKGLQLICQRRGLFGCPATPGIVYLLGCKEPDSPFWQKLTIVLRHKNCCVTVQPEGAEGYDPKLILCDFNGDKQDEIYLSMATGGSGGYEYFYIYMYDEHKCALNLVLDDDKYNAQSQYIAYYLDGYKLAVVQRDGNKTWIIDLSCRGAEYLNQIYDEHGYLIKPVSGMVGGANYTQPYVNKQTCKCDLLVYQRITGLYSADLIGYVHTIMAYDKDGFVPLFPVYLNPPLI
ncbi:MAG: VCBS repeat-containing protein [Proteobacteria bacterium]|nr:VCBS repeat-containing protein [Pseudomonadota bacterium]